MEARNENAPSEQISTVVSVSCVTCRQEVPASEAVVPEAADYVINFCGLDFYQQWRQSWDDAS